jgi:hypothetical protein|nr:MAG TPA: cell division cylcle protein [Caudoviricetes sp.]
MAYYITEPLGGSDDVVVSVYKNTGEYVGNIIVDRYKWRMSSDEETRYSIGQFKAENVEQIKGLWPEAYMIECEEVNEITFTTRFPKPKWYNSSSNC